MIAAADAAILAWGVLALFSPGQLIPGYEHYTGQSWPALMHTSPATGGFILLLFRLVGALNIAVALPLTVLAFTAFRARQRWAWRTLLAANTTAFLAPITYDITTGAIGSPTFAEAYSHQIIAVAADANVSGKTDPFVRPKLGPWLTDERAWEFDGIIAAKLDRFARSVRYWSKLVDWARASHKTLICVDPYIDFSTPTGQLVGMIMSWLAEQELAQITDTMTYLRSQNRVTGKALYRYQIVTLNDHKEMVPEPEAASVVRDVAGRYLSGESIREIALALDMPLSRLAKSYPKKQRISN